MNVGLIDAASETEIIGRNYRQHIPALRGFEQRQHIVGKMSQEVPHGGKISCDPACTNIPAKAYARNILRVSFGNGWPVVEGDRAE